MSLILKGKDSITGQNRDAGDDEQFQTWETYTPTGSWNSNISYTGLRRVIGDNLEVRIHGSLSGAPNAVSLTVELPSDVEVDDTKLPSNGVVPVGKAIFRDDDLNATDLGSVSWESSLGNSTVQVSYHLTIGTDSPIRTSDVDSTSPFTWAVDDFFDLEFSIPIRTV